MHLVTLLYVCGCFGKLSPDDEQDSNGSGAVDTDDTADPEDSGDTGGTSETGDTGDLIPGEELTGDLTIGTDAMLFGWSLDEGDIDGDGRDDLLVGAPAVERDDDGTMASAGKAWLFYGPIVPDSHPRSIVFSGISPGDTLGTSLAHGDFNRDGLNDVAVGGGMPTAANPNASGFVSVVYGPFTGDVALSRGTLLGNYELGDAFGASLVVGDFTDDGSDDLVVGSPLSQDIEDSADMGIVVVYAGSTNGITNEDVSSIIIGATGAHLGEALTRGDANGDGADDLLVGAPPANGIEEGAGAAYLFYGPFGESTSVSVVDADSTFLGSNSNDKLGTSVDLDDLDQDGYDDVIIGAPGYDDSGLDAGVAYVYLSTEEFAVLYGEQPGSRAGTSVAFAHDLNDDGAYDLVVGAPGYDEAAAIDAGRSYLMLGPVDGSHSLGASDHLTGYLPNMRLGQAVLGDTELTGDSLADFVVGAPNVNPLDASMGGIIQLMAGGI